MAGLVLLMVLAFAFDALTTHNRIYANVKVGTVDVGGMTTAEAANAIRQAYGTRVAEANVTVYAGQEGKDAAATATAVQDADQSVEEVAAQTNSWQVTAQDLGLWIPAEDWAQAAYETGREGLIERIQTSVFGVTVEPVLGADQTQLQDLANSIDARMGTPRVNWDIAVSGGVASVTPGSDGILVNPATLQNQVSAVVLGNEDGRGEVIAHVESAPVLITQQQAQDAADKVNAALARGIDYRYGEYTWHADGNTAGEWIYTEIVEDNGTYQLNALVNQQEVKNFLLPHIAENSFVSNVLVTFENTDDGVMVYPYGDSTMPDVTNAAVQTAPALFQEGAATPAVTFGDVELPEVMSFDEALSYGVIERISTYTTEYTNTDYTQARNTNIHLASEEITGSIVASGETWSYNETAGDSTADKGYLSAGTIIDGVYSESVGGGLCQVATTVFNAVYDAGFTVQERHNHSLYISSYPIGRDAAIDYASNMDLVWQNDTNSDVILIMSYTEDTVTASLYGVSLHYTVTTDVGDWEEGEKYEIIVKEDETLPKGYSYVDTTGTDGSEISIVQTVFDQEGNVVFSKTYHSVYDPKDEVVKCGPETEVNTDRNNNEEKTSTRQ
ncbi:MAG: VanW family protein [Coriobacteriia bacterium]|nr:VanW family protein [Coriobacteriia bacterium]